jgi:hypothetical protein
MTTCSVTADSSSSTAAPTCTSYVVTDNGATPPAGATEVPCDSVPKLPAGKALGSDAPDSSSLTCYKTETPPGS